MSGDLISRSRLTEEIRGLRVTVTGLRAGKGILSEFEKQYRESILKVIDNQPTAYDVDKVVERLEEEVKYQNEKAEEEPLFCELTFEEARRKMAECYEHAIEIVKAGGVK